MKIPQNIKAVIFDFDGLLIDSEPLWSEARNQIFGKFRLQYTLNDKRQTMGGDYRGGIAYFIKKYQLPISIESFIEQEQSILDKLYVEKLTLMPGASHLIEEIDKAKILRAIASGGPSNRVEFAIKELNISGFGVVVSGDDIAHGKPNPEIFLKAADMLGVKLQSCVVLEDARLGIMAAKAAGMCCVAVVDERFSKVDDFAGEAEPDLLVKSLNELTIERLMKLVI